MVMPRAILRTARLTLRPLEPPDAGAIAAVFRDWAVVRWLVSPPWPYGLADAEAFLAGEVSKGAMAVVVDGAFAGCVQIATDGELGYWLAPRLHGKGLMTEAVGALVAEHFRCGRAALISGYLAGNQASARVQAKLGFLHTHMERTLSVPLGRDVDHLCTRLTAETWGDLNPLVIETERLVLRPLTQADAPALSTHAGFLALARMLASVRAPWPEDALRAWIDQSRWRGRLGFRLGVTLREDGRLIGSVGAGGEPLSVAYVLGRRWWGQGLATEAMSAFVAELDVRFAPPAIEAEHFADNPASGRVLAKLGFVRVAETLGGSAGRILPAPMWLWRREHPGFP
jgi:RimJ/RimL family protein N-acetyltransferase